MNAKDLNCLLISIAQKTACVDGSVESAEEALVSIREDVRRALLEENVALVVEGDGGCPGCSFGFEDEDVPPICPNCRRTIIKIDP